MEKKKRRLNIVDIVVIVVILAAAVFLGWKLTHRGGDIPAARRGTIRFVVEVDGLRKDLYESTADLVPCQMAASGSLVDGYILEAWANPVEVVSIKAKSPVNQSLEQELLPEEGVEYVNAYYLCECAVDLNDKLNLTGKPDRELTAAEWTPVNIAPWTRTMRKVYDPDAVEATGDPDKQFAVFNIGSVKACTFGGGFGGRVVSGALAKAGGGVSILGNTGLNISLDDLAGVLNVYVPNVRNAGVYSENGFTVEAEEVRSGESASGSAGGFAGYTSGAQISNSDVYQLKRTEVKAPAILETANAPTYFDESTYAVTGGAYAGGYVGNMDIGSAASVGNGLKVLGETIQLTNIASALSVVVTTIEHSDVQGMGGGFSVRAGKPDVNGNVGKSGGFAGEVSGGHIQNSHCKNFYYIIGMEAAGGYVGNMKPGNVAKLLDNGSILDPAKLLGIDSALATLVEDFVPTIRNSTTSCVPCGGVVRAQAASDDAHQRGCAGGYCGHNEGGHIWGLNTKVWKTVTSLKTPLCAPTRANGTSPRRGVSVPFTARNTQAASRAIWKARTPQIQATSSSSAD